MAFFVLHATVAGRALENRLGQLAAEGLQLRAVRMRRSRQRRHQRFPNVPVRIST